MGEEVVLELVLPSWLSFTGHTTGVCTRQVRLGDCCTTVSPLGRSSSSPHPSSTCDNHFRDVPILIIVGAGARMRSALLYSRRSLPPPPRAAFYTWLLGYHYSCNSIESSVDRPKASRVESDIPCDPEQILFCFIQSGVMMFYHAVCATLGCLALDKTPDTLGCLNKEGC